MVDELHLFDGFPMPVCEYARVGRSQIFADDAHYGYCASKEQKYYGFKGNLLINSEGIITQITVTPANVDEREALWEVFPNIHGMVIADKGLIGTNYQQELREFAHIDLQTALRNNMPNTRNPKWVQ